MGLVLMDLLRHKFIFLLAMRPKAIEELRKKVMVSGEYVGGDSS